MAIPSHILAAGNSPLSTRVISGGGIPGIVALGTNQATATQLSAPKNTITTSSASTGLKLPPCEDGIEILIYNLSGQTLQIYTSEPSGVTMNAAVAGSTGVALGNTKTAICYAASATAWVVTCALTST